jgi:MFS family permease
MHIKQLFRVPRFGKEMLLLNWPTRFISILFFVYFLGWGIANPYFTVYIRDTLGSYAAVGLITSALYLSIVIWALIIGPLIDSVNKRIFTSVVLLLYIPMSPIILMLQNVWHFLLFRAYHSAVSTSLWSTSLAYVREHSPQGKEIQSMGLFDFGYGLAQVVGGAVGAVLVIYFGFNILYAVSFFALLGMIFSFWLPDHSRKGLKALKHLPHFSKIKKEVRHYVRRPGLKALTLYTFPYFMVVPSLLMIVPLFADYLGGGLPMIGIAAALYALPLLFESYFSTVVNQNKVIVLGIVFGGVLSLALFFTTQIVMMFILTLLLGVAMSALYPNFYGRFTTLMPRHGMGEYSTVLFAVKSLAAAIGPLLSGFIADAWGLQYVFLFVLVVFAGLFGFRRMVMGK